MNIHLEIEKKEWKKNTKKNNICEMEFLIFFTLCNFTSSSECINISEAICMENINKNENITLVASDSCEYPVFELVIELLRDPRTFN